MTTSLPPDLQRDDLLWRHLKTVPAFRALLRAVEARFYLATELPGPILDLGCGDGHFAQMVFPHKLTVGLDPWWGPLNKAANTNMYEGVVQGMGNRLPFPDNTFGSAISNSVLEHIPDIQPVLNEIGRVLQPNGRFLITMPCHRFTCELGGAAFFERLGMDGMANRYRHFFNTITRHAHTDSAEIWAGRLAEAGLGIERWQYYFSTGALRALEWGHVQGLPSAILHAISGHWIAAPWESSLAPTERWLRPYYEEPFTPDGTYVVFIARKVANGPIPVHLPPARPFTQAELNSASPILIEPEQPEPLAEKGIPAAESPATAVTSSPIHQRPPRPAPTGAAITAGLGLAGVLAILLGQLILSGNPLNASSGLRWFAIGFVALLAVAWWQRPRLADSGWRLPTLGPIPRQRWWTAPALLLAVLAQRWGSAGSDWLALFSWLGAAALGTYALWQSRTVESGGGENGRSRFTWLAAAAIFLIALLLRTLNITQHPFILNGIEASLGLDAIYVLRGAINNPFATGWLTNPTLPAYLQAIPIALLGQTTLALRLLPALIGAITVVSTFFIGQRLFGQAVGLTSAVLLAGMHLHLHYSRLGMTNIWDPLLVLVALGAVALAWERPSRSRWLLAGALIGLNAYLFTSARLLPLMLATLLITVILLDRQAIRQQWRHWLAAILLAAILALPQILFYRQNPTIFMERANTLGILDGQTGWLSQESSLRNIPATDLLGQQLRAGLLAFNTGLDQSPAYRPGTGLLSFWMATLYILGFGLALTRWRQFRYRLLIIWVVITVIFAAALLLQPPNSHRLVTATPAVALLAGIGLVAVGEWLVQFLPGREKLAAFLLPLLLLAASVLTVRDVAFYYGRYRQTHQFADRNSEVADRMGHYLQQLDEGWTAYFYGSPAMFADFPTITYLAPSFQRNNNLIDVIDMDVDFNAAGNSTFIILPENAQALSTVQAEYPNGVLQTIDGYYGRPLFWIYEVRP